MLGIFLDQETTGLDSLRHRVLEIAFVIVDLTTGEEKYSFDSIVGHKQEVWDARDPLSIIINGFTWEELVEKGKSEQELAVEIKKIFKDAGIVRGKSVFICQNPSFDRCFFSQIIDPYTQEKLYWPYHWLDFASMYWTLIVKKSQEAERVVPKEVKLSKDAIALASNLPAESRPHRAMQGVRHLLLCYSHVIGFTPREPLL